MRFLRMLALALGLLAVPAGVLVSAAAAADGGGAAVQYSVDGGSYDGAGNLVAHESKSDSQQDASHAAVSFTGGLNTVSYSSDVAAGTLADTTSAQAGTADTGAGAGAWDDNSGSATVSDTITLAQAATVTLVGTVDGSVSAASSDLNDQPTPRADVGVELDFTGGDCPRPFAEAPPDCGGYDNSFSADPSAPAAAPTTDSFSVPVALPAGTTDFAATLSVDERLLVDGAGLESASSQQTVRFSIVVPAGVGVASGSGLLPISGGAPLANTPAGTNVAVTPADAATGATPVTVTFDDVSAPGETTLTIGSVGPDVPATFSIGQPPTYYELATTASFSGAATVCVGYGGLALTGSPRLLHYDGTSWVDTTTSVDSVGDVVCGSVTSFSPFVVAARAPDTTPPAIACGSADGVWHASDVSIACTASDDGSGLANADDASFTLTTDVPAGRQDANASTGTRTVCDVAGNCATAGPIGGNEVDKAAPSIAIDAPTGTVTLGQVVAASYACSDDGGSGVAACTAPVASGAPVDTSGVGAKTFTVDAVDAVGNSASETADYTVAYGVCPVGRSPAVAHGRVAVVVLRLCDASGRDVSARTIAVHAVSLDGNLVATPGHAFPGGDFRYVAGTYLLVLETRGLAPGTHTLAFTAAGDPTPHTLPIVVAHRHGDDR